MIMSGLKCECLQPAGLRGWLKALCAAGYVKVFYSVLHQLQFSKATSGCNLLFCTMGVEEGKDYLEGILVC